MPGYTLTATGSASVSSGLGEIVLWNCQRDRLSRLCRRRRAMHSWQYVCAAGTAAIGDVEREVTAL